VLRAPKRFDLIGFRWRRHGPARLAVRARGARRQWSAWVEIPAAGSHGPDGAVVFGTEPVWIGGADDCQVRIAGRARALRAHFVNSTGTTAAVGRLSSGLRRAVAAAARTVTGTTAGVPAIIPRAAWGGDGCPPRTNPSHGDVELAFVHHTVGANDYGREDSAAIVLAICRYHRNVNGWNDIGYNFLVDKYGQVFEGRAGGIEAAVVGAQAQGYNAHSTGIANLGTFSTAGQSEAALNALAQLIAWKLSLHGVPVQGQVTMISGGGSSNRYPAGSKVTFERIAGHRDGDATACPGDGLYAQLAELRVRAAALANSGPVAKLTLAAVTRVKARRSARIFGQLTLADGSSPARAAIEVQVRGPGGYRTAATATTAFGGQWAVALKRLSSVTVRARYRDPNGGATTTSPPLDISVVPRIAIRASTNRLVAGSSVLVAGRVWPPKRHARLTVERRQPGGGYARVANLPVRLRQGRFRHLLRLRRPGLYRVTLHTAADARNAATRSDPLAIRAINRRGRSGRRSRQPTGGERAT
jgi:N-acetylmuramoyl-L-alanine amidase-like protein